VKIFLKKIKCHYYIITLILAIFFYIRSGFRPLSILDFLYSNYGIDGHLIILILSFVIALLLGLKGAYMNKIYPFFVASLLYVVLPFIALMINFQDRYLHGFIHYVLIGFLLIFLPHLIIPFLGLKLGTQITSYRERKVSRRCQQGLGDGCDHPEKTDKICFPKVKKRSKKS